MKSIYNDLKNEVLNANLEIPKRGLAIYTWGNVSSVDRNRGVFAIKPSGVPYDELKLDDIVVVSLSGEVVEGKLSPSSDTPTHRVLYNSFSDIGGICHTHSPYATSWAQSRLSIPIQGTTHADHSPNPIPCTPFLSKEMVEKGYEENTGKIIVDTFRDPSISMLMPHEIEYPSIALDPNVDKMVLVAGHGPFTWGINAHKSVYNAAVLEEIAKMAYIMMPLQNNIEMLPSYIIKKHYERKHGKNAYYGQNN
jgi:L-ribulose-5-phosphate 4-epimerase